MLARAIESLTSERLVWSMALCVQEEPLDIDRLTDHPIKVFNAKRLDPLGRRPHTLADPFLLVRDGVLYVFFEIVEKGGHGKIAAYETEDLQNFDDLGIVLETGSHLSFPFVFEDEGSVYLVPESGRAESLDLYRFEAFPRLPKKVRALLTGPYCDSHLLRHEGNWYIFTTREDRMEIYFSPDLLSGEFIMHPANPISTDPRFRRSAGATLSVNGKLHRLSQDCSEDYGKNVHLLEIEELSPFSYREKLAAENIIKLEREWNPRGAHHLTICQFKGKTIIATDGKQADLFVNRFSSLARVIPRLRRRFSKG